MGKLELTLALFKPDIALNETVVNSIKQLITAHKFTIVRSKVTRMTLDQAKSFYQVHESKKWLLRENAIVLDLVTLLIKCLVFLNRKVLL